MLKTRQEVLSYRVQLASEIIARGSLTVRNEAIRELDLYTLADALRDRGVAAFVETPGLDVVAIYEKDGDRWVWIDNEQGDKWNACLYVADNDAGDDDFSPIGNHQYRHLVDNSDFLPGVVDWICDLLRVLRLETKPVADLTPDPVRVAINDVREAIAKLDVVLSERA